MNLCCYQLYVFTVYLFIYSSILIAFISVLFLSSFAFFYPSIYFYYVFSLFFLVHLSILSFSSFLPFSFSFSLTIHFFINIFSSNFLDAVTRNVEHKKTLDPKQSDLCNSGTFVISSFNSPFTKALHRSFSFTIFLQSFLGTELHFS